MTAAASTPRSSFVRRRSLGRTLPEWLTRSLLSFTLAVSTGATQRCIRMSLVGTRLVLVEVVAVATCPGGRLATSSPPRPVSRSIPIASARPLSAIFALLLSPASRSTAWHTYATLALSSGVNPRIVSGRLGALDGGLDLGHLLACLAAGRPGRCRSHRGLDRALIPSSADENVGAFLPLRRRKRAPDVR